jgi:hypothetical protein
MSEYSWYSRFNNDISKLNGKINNSPIVNGKLLKDIDVSDTAKSVKHQLGRVPEFVIVVLCNANVSVWTSKRDNTIVELTASGAAKVNIWVA